MTSSPTTSSPTTSRTNAKPALSFWQIWNMCFGFLGIQFGFALQNANVSRIFQTLGASMDDILSASVRFVARKNALNCCDACLEGAQLPRDQVLHERNCRTISS